MIFVTVGTQKFQFDRLLKAMDEYVRDNPSVNVYGQTGFSAYKPKFFESKPFLSKEEFNHYLNLSSVVVAHAGVGTIMACLEHEKKIIVMPRSEDKCEHVDNHQDDLALYFNDMGYLKAVYSKEELFSILDRVESLVFKKYSKKSSLILDDINETINEW